MRLPLFLGTGGGGGVTSPSGPKFPGSGADDATVGTIAWTNPGNIVADDGASATAGTFSSSTHYAKGLGFGFAIPGGKTINGIKLEVKVGGDTTSGNDSSVKLVKGSTISGSDRSAGAAIVNGAAVYETFGGSSDLWGLAWTPADINSATFGAVYSASSAGIFTTISVDAMRITVYFS